MAEAVVSDIVAAIIAKLGSSVFKEIGLWRGLKDELKKLNKTVAMIQAVLHDAEKQSSKNEQIKTWLADLKEVAYDAEDLVDLYSTQALRKQTISNSKLGKEVRIFFSRSNQLVYGHKMSHKIKYIREQIDEIYKNKTFMLDACLVNNVGGNTRETHSSLPHVFVGRENDKNEIMKVLLSPVSYQNNVSVISIVGIGGLGKTTLAQLLLDDSEVKNHFELKLWVCVAESFDIKSILEKILESIQGRKSGNLEMNTLKNQLHRCINGKKYMIVLDDVWNAIPQKWSELLDLLYGGAKGSKIIITTRLKNVARIARSDVEHELKGLSDDESWDLFKKVAFVGGEVPSANLEEIGKEIVKKCKGVPLAIKTIGGLLYSKESEFEWQSFKDGELSTINQLEDTDILPTLKLSYNHLPSHLKHCFAYCRLFPKDYEINVQTLIDLWIAQGFVQSSNATQSLTDIGLQYFKELLWRSFFQEVKEDYLGNIYTCKMHDLMHDLAISVAGGEVASSNSNKPSIDDKTQHVSIDFESGFKRKDFHSICNASKARTFLLLNKFRFDFFYRHETFGEKECYLIFSKLKCLRALDLTYMGIEKVPHTVNKLKLLTYLDLSDNGMKKLPNSICSLLNLQVLKVDCCRSLEELPKDIRKFVNLRRLSMRGCDGLTHMPRGIGELKGLEALSDFVVDKKGCGAELNELKNLKNLRGSLRIRNLRYVKNPKTQFQALNLKERHYILDLELVWASSTSVEYGEEFFATDIEIDEMAMEVFQPHHNLKKLSLYSYKGAKSPSWLPSLTALEILDLNKCKNIQCLPPLDQFASLKILGLLELSNLEYIESGISFFPSLVELQISGCPNLKGWLRGQNGNCRTESSPPTTTATEFPYFQRLSKLVIRRCPNLNSMPPCPSIESLNFNGNSLKQLEQLLKPSISVAEHTSSSPLSQLKVISIFGISEEASLPGELLQKITSLTTLEIFSWPGIVKMETPPFGLRGLRSLWLLFMNEMESLPNWMQHLSTLNNLVLAECSNLASLPEWMSNLTSLQGLRIWECPKLSERCKNNKGEDWPKITRIPNIEVDWSRVQQNGRYFNE